MEIINIKEIASVKIFQLELSEDELMVYASGLKVLRESKNELKLTGATPDEISSIHDDLIFLLQKHSDLFSLMMTNITVHAVNQP